MPKPKARERTISIVEIIVSGLVLLLCVNAIAPYLNLSPLIRVVWASGENNQINYAEVWQYNETAWNLVINFTVTGGSTRVHDSWITKFIVGTQFNSSLAGSGSEADGYTNLTSWIGYPSPLWGTNVTGWGSGSPPVNAIFNRTSTTLVGDFYLMVWEGNWTSELPASGVTYNCTLDFWHYW